MFANVSRLIIGAFAIFSTSSNLVAQSLLMERGGGDPIARKGSFDEAKDVSIPMMKSPWTYLNFLTRWWGGNSNIFDVHSFLVGKIRWTHFLTHIFFTRGWFQPPTWAASLWEVWSPLATSKFHPWPSHVVWSLGSLEVDGPGRHPKKGELMWDVPVNGWICNFFMGWMEDLYEDWSSYFKILDDDQELKYCHSHDLKRRIDSIRFEFKDFQCARWLVTSCLSRSNRASTQKGNS